jgi:hypothetical protein
VRQAPSAGPAPAVRRPPHDGALPAAVLRHQLSTWKTYRWPTWSATVTWLRASVLPAGQRFGPSSQAQQRMLARRVIAVATRRYLAGLQWVWETCTQEPVCAHPRLSQLRPDAGPR